jgi:hypothetical protein
MSFSFRISEEDSVKSISFSRLTRSVDIRPKLGQLLALVGLAVLVSNLPVVIGSSPANHPSTLIGPPFTGVSTSISRSNGSLGCGKDTVRVPASWNAATGLATGSFHSEASSCTKLHGVTYGEAWAGATFTWSKVVHMASGQGQIGFQFHVSVSGWQSAALSNNTCQAPNASSTSSCDAYNAFFVKSYGIVEDLTTGANVSWISGTSASSMTGFTWIERDSDAWPSWCSSYPYVACMSSDGTSAARNFSASQDQLQWMPGFNGSFNSNHSYRITYYVITGTVSEIIGLIGHAYASLNFSGGGKGFELKSVKYA